MEPIDAHDHSILGRVADTMSGEEGAAGDPVARVVRTIVESEDYQSILEQFGKAAERINQGELQALETDDGARKIDSLAGPELREAAAQPGLIMRGEGTLTVGAKAIQALLQPKSTLTVGPTAIPSGEAFGQPTINQANARDEAAIAVTESVSVQMIARSTPRHRRSP